MDADDWLEQQLRRLHSYKEENDPLMRQKKHAEKMLLEVSGNMNIQQPAQRLLSLALLWGFFGVGGGDGGKALLHFGPHRTLS